MQETQHRLFGIGPLLYAQAIWLCVTDRREAVARTVPVSQNQRQKAVRESMRDGAVVVISVMIQTGSLPADAPDRMA